MAKYTTKPQTVEAMQWLGPDDPAHVAEFEAWVKGVSLSGEIEDEQVRFCGDYVALRPEWFVWFDGEWFYSGPESVFHARYTPTPDVEGGEIEKLRSLLLEAVGWNWLDDDAESEIPRYDEIIDATGLRDNPEIEGAPV